VPSVYGIVILSRSYCHLGGHRVVILSRNSESSYLSFRRLQINWCANAYDNSESSYCCLGGYYRLIGLRMHMVILSLLIVV
jgi:hypothetical protein